MALPLIVLLIGLGGGLLSGLLGIGGGIVTAPLLLYLPRLLGQEPLSMHVVGGLTISQALFASLFGSFGHWRTGNVDRRLAVVMSGVIFAGALAGGAGSHWFSHRFLLGLFLLLSLAAAALILLPQPARNGTVYAPGAFPVAGAVAIALVVGLLGGLVGQGGSFILIPLTVALLKVPLRVAMGSNMVIIFFASLAGFIGKAATGQVPPPLAAALLAGILPGSLAGVALSRRVSTPALRTALAILILAACARMALDVVR
ncbi:MAG TPA: sulfite exporter TauE/SafE family protein [bacterium]